MLRIFVLLVILSIILNYANTLRCYTCKSSTNDGCLDVDDSMDYLIRECSLTTLGPAITPSPDPTDTTPNVGSTVLTISSTEALNVDEGTNISQKTTVTSEITTTTDVPETETDAGSSTTSSEDVPKVTSPNFGSTDVTISSTDALNTDEGVTNIPTDSTPQITLVNTKSTITSEMITTTGILETETGPGSNVTLSEDIPETTTGILENTAETTGNSLLTIMGLTESKLNSLEYTTRISEIDTENIMRSSNVETEISETSPEDVVQKIRRSVDNNDNFKCFVHKFTIKGISYIQRGCATSEEDKCSLGTDCRICGSDLCNTSWKPVGIPATIILLEITLGCLLTFTLKF